MQKISNNQILINFATCTLFLNKNWEQGIAQKPFPENQAMQTPFQVVQRFSQPKKENEGELVVELLVYTGSKVSQFSNYFQLVPHEQIINFKQTETKRKITSTYGTRSLSSKEMLNSQQLSYLKENTQGAYQFVNNGLKVKIVPFQEMNFSLYDEKEVQIQEIVTQTDKGTKVVSIISHQNLEIQVGFNYEIVELETPLKSFPQQIGCYEEITDETQMVEENNNNNNNYHQVAQIDSQKSTPKKDSYKMDIQEELKIDIPLTNNVGEKYPFRKNTGISQLNDDDTTADISESQMTYECKGMRRCRRKRTISKVSQEEMEDPNFVSQKSNFSSGQKKGDKKNVVKNFVKAFRSYLQAWGDAKEICEILQIKEGQELEQFRNNWLSFERENNYNNKLIKLLITSRVYSNLFSFFLENRASDWLKNSQVQDKKSHFEVLSGYIKASQNKGELDNIVILKSRN